LLKLPHRFGFDLTDTLSGDLEDVANFFEGVAISIAEAIAELDDFAFSVAEGFQN
jgi:hypothetical protein